MSIPDENKLLALQTLFEDYKRSTQQMIYESGKLAGKLSKELDETKTMLSNLRANHALYVADNDRLRDELVKLRVSVARVAQAHEVSLNGVSLDIDSPYQVIRRAAEERDRGWNALAQSIAEHRHLKLEPRELCTVLAALRRWQEHTNMVDRANDIIANDNGCPLYDEEIDALCERMNCS